MSNSLVIAGLGMVAMGVAGRTITRFGPMILQNVEKKVSALPKINFKSLVDVHYYKGGFDAKMTKREAALVLGVSPAAPKSRIREAHRRIMLLNHPDKGGSPLIAAKINEAKDVLEKTT